jgi:hypothetical protein
MTGTCYYCGAPATSDEHAPPRALFPKLKDSPDGRNYRLNLQTVRSCDVHNTQKSKEDEYLLYILVMSLPSNDIAKSQFLTTVKRAIEYRPKLLDRMLIKYREVTYHDTENDIWHRSIAIQPDEARLTEIFRCIAKAMYVVEKETFWPYKISVMIEFMLALDDVARNERQAERVREVEAFLNAAPHKGNNPEIFTYQFVEHDGHALMRLHFYGNTRVSVVFIPG